MNFHEHWFYRQLDTCLSASMYLESINLRDDWIHIDMYTCWLKSEMHD